MNSVQQTFGLAWHVKSLNIWVSTIFSFLMLGFHRFSQGLSQEEEEGRANTWWDIYLFDRYRIVISFPDLESWQDSKAVK